MLLCTLDGHKYEVGKSVLKIYIYVSNSWTREKNMDVDYHVDISLIMAFTKLVCFSLYYIKYWSQLPGERDPENKT